MDLQVNLIKYFSFSALLATIAKCKSLLDCNQIRDHVAELAMIASNDTGLIYFNFYFQHLACLISSFELETILILSLTLTQQLTPNVGTKWIPYHLETPRNSPAQRP